MESTYSAIPSLRNRSAANAEDESGGEDKSAGKGKSPWASLVRSARNAATGFSASPYAPLAAVAGTLIVLTWILVSVGRHNSTPSALKQGSLTALPCQTDGEKPRPFIFVYDLGGKYTSDVLKGTPNWFSEVYNAEQAVLEYILGTSAIRTWDPEKAMLFYIPFYSSYYLSCRFKDWENNMREAVTRTSEMWEVLLNQVRSDFPYFNRTNGGDHFAVLSMDFGRCQNLPYVEPRTYGDMFFVQMNGDKMLRSTHTHMKRNMQILTYNYGAHTSSDIPDIPCYRSDRDIVLPPLLEDATKRPMHVTSPFEGDRGITVLMRFRTEHHHKLPVHHNNHNIRKELFDLYRRKGLEAWEFGVREPEKIMREDMQKSLFCVCPPGHSQWTTRLAKAVLAGCIPVTIFRDNDSPWQEEIEYSLFSINVDPEALGTLFERIENTLRNPRKLLSLQRNLEKVQKLFMWNETSPLGVQAHLGRVLWCRAKKLDRGGVGIMRRDARSVSGRSKTARL